MGRSKRKPLRTVVSLFPARAGKPRVAWFALCTLCLGLVSFGQAPPAGADDAPPVHTDDLSQSPADGALPPIDGAPPTPPVRTDALSQSPAADAPQAPPQRPAGKPGEIDIRNFQDLHYSLNDNSVRTQGGAMAVYTDPQTGDVNTLTAQELEYNGTSGLLRARGGVHLDRGTATLTGQEIEYNFRTRVGFVTMAEIASDLFRVRGKRIETLENGNYVVTDGDFTTCLRGRPDYRLHARRLTLVPNDHISARGLSFYAGPTRLITVPSYRQSLKDSAASPTPLPGYDRTDGLFVRLQGSPISMPRKALNFDVRVNFHKLPTGYVAYQSDLMRPLTEEGPPRSLLPNLENPLRGFLEQINPPTIQDVTQHRFEEEPARRFTWFAVLQNDQFVYNRRRNDLDISRFPAIGIQGFNLLSRTPPGAPPPLPTGTEALLEPIPNAPFLLDATAALSALQEQPTNVTAGRLAFRTSLATQPLRLGRHLALRAGVTNWLNFYSTGSIYELVSPEVQMNYVPTSTSFIGVGYQYLNDVGRTPFLFDRRDIRHDLHLYYQVGGPWGFGVLSAFDLERSRNYDTQFAVVRNFDCMQVGLIYRTRSQQFGLIFNLLPPNRFRRARPANGR